MVEVLLLEGAGNAIQCDWGHFCPEKYPWSKALRSKITLLPALFLYLHAKS